jgi:hypothetical protein
MVIEGGNGPGRGGAKPRARRGARVESPQTVLRLPDDPYDVDYPKRPGRGRGILALAGVTVVVSAVIAISSSQHGGKTPQAQSIAGVGGGVPPASAAQTSSAGVGTETYSDSQFPGTKSNGVMVGYPDTKEGAEAAATNYVAAYGSEVMLRTSTRHTMIHTIADPAIEQDLQGKLDQAFAIVANGYKLDKDGNPPKGLTVVSRAFPVGVQVTAYTNNKATVAVWANSIGGTSGTGSTHPVIEAWDTITLDLSWVNGDWKWSNFSEIDGPTPVSSQAASSSDLLQKAAQQFARLRYAP